MEGLNIYYSNADVLSNKMDILRHRVSARKPDVICINEVKPKNCRFEPFAAEFSFYESAGYKFLPNNIENEVGRGQVVLYKKCLDAKQVYINSKFEEHCLLEIYVLRIHQKCY